MSLDHLGVTWRELPYVNTRQGGLIIASSGRCVWDDLMRMDKEKEWDIMVLNDLIMHFPYKFDHAYSNDHHWLPKWLEARRPLLKQRDGTIHTHTCTIGDNMTVWPWPGHGSSSLNAAYTGLALGYDEIVLCGCPLDNSGHYFDPPWVQTNFNSEIKETDEGPRFWANAAKYIFEGKVTSMSGRTKELLGE